MSWDYTVVSLEDGSLIRAFKATNLKPIQLRGKHVTPRKTDVAGGIIDIYFCGEDKDGIFLIAHQRAKDTELTFYEKERYIVKYPIQKGTTWESHNI